MTPSFDPPRIASGRANVPDGLRDAVQSAAADGPTPEQIEQLSGVLAPIFASPPAAYIDAGASGISEAPAAGAKVLGAGKAATALALVVVSGVGGYAAWRWLEPSGSDSQNIAPATIVQPAPAAQTPEPIPIESLPLADPPFTGPSPSPKPREAARPRAVEPPAAQPAPAAEPPKAQLSESELVDLARRSVASDPRKALALAQEHHRRFAGAPLSEEADFIEIEAMKRLGRFEEARSLDERFRKRYPTSMHGQTVTVKPAPSP
jgi:hypothetical protein